MNDSSRHMVYQRVSNLFDLSLHVLISRDLKLDISMSVYTRDLFLSCILLLYHAIGSYLFIHVIVHVFLGAIAFSFRFGCF